MSRLDNLRKEAKRWLKALREQNHTAWTRFRTVLPGAPAQPVLRDVQHALAREHGFENWAAFARALDTNLAVQQFDRLAGDLLVAYERGDPDAMQRLAAQFGGRLTWDDLRQGVHQRLATTPKAEVPEGAFALPHARLLVATQLGFDNWNALVEGLTTRGSALTRPAQAGPEFDPGMIDPVEVRAGLAVRLFDGTPSTMTEVWSTLTAARNGDLDRVIDLVTARPPLVRCDYNYMPPLHLAVRENHIDIVRFLIGRGAAKQKYETYPYRESLVTLARDRRYEGVARLLEASSAAGGEDQSTDGSGEIQYPKDEERDRLQKLVSGNALAEVEEILQRRPDLAVNPFLFWGEGILSMPANRGHREMIDLLKRYGARVPAVTKWGAWYYFKRYDVAALLLEHGMSPNHMNTHHTTLLHDMAYTGDVAKAQLLLAHGARIDAVDEEFRSTPLGVAARFGKLTLSGCSSIAAPILRRRPPNGRRRWHGPAGKNTVRSNVCWPAWRLERQLGGYPRRLACLRGRRSFRHRRLRLDTSRSARVLRCWRVRLKAGAAVRWFARRWLGITVSRAGTAWCSPVG